MTFLLPRPRRSRCLSQLALAGLLGVLAALALGLPAPADDRDERDRGPGDDPGAAQEFAALLQQDDSGDIPRHALFDAVKQLNAMRGQVGLQAKVAGLPVGVQVESKDLTPLVGGLSPGGWKWLGPGNIGGRANVLLIHPRNPQILFAGTAGAGVWKSSNGGKRWEVLGDILAMVSVGCLVSDPSNPDIIFAGTGDGWGRVAQIHGEGIWKSRDSGKTWDRLEGTAGKDFDRVNRLAISPDGKVMLAATGTGLFRKAEGSSWQKVQDTEFRDVRFHPRDSSLCIAGGWHGKALHSSDGGAKWQAAEGLPSFEEKKGVPLGRVELTYAVADPKIVYASVDNNEGEVYRSADGGKTYELKNTGHKYLASGGHSQGYYGNTIWAGDPSSADHVIVGGLDLWRSTDGGKEFTQISLWYKAPQSAHADQHWIASDPRFDGKDNKAVYFGNDGGVYKTDDITTAKQTEGWQVLNNNFGATQFYGAAGNVRSGVLIGGAQDNGTSRLSREEGEHQWSQLIGGDGGYCAIDPDKPDYCYGEAQYLRIYRSTDGGKTSGRIYLGITDVDRQDAPPKANFIPPFILDPNDSGVLLAGAESLWRCPDARADKPVWKAIKPPHKANKPGYQYISAIAVARGDSGNVWVGHNDGSLYHSSNAKDDKPDWKRIQDQTPVKLPHRICSRITIDPRNSKRLFVCFGGYYESADPAFPDNVWRSEDGGNGWKTVPIQSEGKEALNAPVFDLAIHPSNPRYLYLATQVGLFASEDDGRHWSPTNEGPTSCPVYQLFWMDKTLVAATHGRGLYQIDLGRVTSRH